MTDRDAAGQIDVDVLVVGAGPTGLTLACDLARRGVGVRVVDRAVEAFRGSRGKGLQPRTLEVLDDLGVLDAVLAAGSAYPRLRVHVGRWSFPWELVERARPSDEVPYPDTWLLPQARTEAILAERLDVLGVHVERGTELTDLAGDDDGVTTTLASAQGRARVRARYLVGADGGHSAVRARLGVPLAGASIESAGAIVGDFHVDGLDRGGWHVWPRARGGAVALCPLPDGELFQLFAALTLPPGSELTASLVAEAVAAAIGRDAPRLRDATWLSTFRPQARLAERYRQGRIFLAGDAAHVHPPTGGQGLNAGVQDAYNLGWKLAAVCRGAPEALLDTYEQERRPVAAEILGLSSALWRGRRWKRRGDATKQLRTSYRGGPLAPLDSGARGRVQAGDRAPDARGVDETGQPRRLFDVTRGPQATLLAFGESAHRAAQDLVRSFEGIRLVRATREPVGPGAPAFSDRTGALARAYGAGAGSIVLVRPDGYVGLVSHDGSPETLAAYVRRIAAPARPSTDCPRSPASFTCISS